MARSATRGALHLARILLGSALSPFPRQVERFYSSLQEEMAEFLGNRNLNLGYWSADCRDHSQASLALIRAVARRAELRRGQCILDVGCGFGSADGIFRSEFGVGCVVGLNITKSQLRYALATARRDGASDGIHFAAGTAVNIPCARDTFDHVIALESCFHFVPREDFFREAFRVLRPGGVLTIADVLKKGGHSQRLLKGLAAYAWLYPSENRYGVDEYRARIATAGFDAIEWESIGDHVYVPYARWALSPQNRARRNAILGQPWSLAYFWKTKVMEILAKKAIIDYILVRAQKPEVLTTTPSS